ncbi:DUF4335 domain-containing protein [Cylindrospermopsis raciborskii]|uniref:DUF4335 domain-containing protein n=1 Tax=Cylindrospermopsis raciborskii TaxID=77022 RepID=UPI0038D1A690
MNIQRKYSLPNCTILLEGFSTAPSTTLSQARPEMSILINAECYLSGYNQPISGGREFFESLVRAVSGYAQEFLSNVPNPQAHSKGSELVEVERINNDRHQLIIYSDSTDTRDNPLRIDMNTVGLFDLVEAVDQFFADSQTLPELILELQPVSRSYGVSGQVALRQAVPATVGVSSLAIAALALGIIPPPQWNPTTQNTQTSSGVPESSPASTTSPTPDSTVASDIQDLEALLNTVPEITDPSQLKSLNRQVYNQINSEWQSRGKIGENLIYRIGVAADGRIIGYKSLNQSSNDQIEKTPLPRLLYNPVSGTGNKEPIAQFRVVFTNKSQLQVSPWIGYSRTPDVIGDKITDPTSIRELNQTLYQTIRQNWSIKPSFPRELRYRVAINKSGVIADYEPLNQVAFDYYTETPLPEIFKTLYGSNLAAPKNREPLAHFRVLFKPNGVLEVSPWEGYR